MTYQEHVELIAFQRWAKDRGYDLREHPHVDWRFLCERTEDAWRGWQARAWAAALDSEKQPKRAAQPGAGARRQGRGT